VQAWFALGPFVSFAAVSLPGNLFVNGGAFAAIWSLGLAVMCLLRSISLFILQSCVTRLIDRGRMPTTTQQNTVVARWVLVGKAAVLRSIVGDHYEAVEQLALAHSQILASCGSHRIKAYAVAPMLCRAYAEAGLAHSAAAKSLVATVIAAVDENCSGCKWWHCINWIERLLGGERSGDWLALRAHMTAATTPDDLETILRQLNSAAARGYTPTTTEGSQGASELALVGMAPPGQADEERLFWSQVPSSLNAPLRCRYHSCHSAYRHWRVCGCRCRPTECVASSKLGAGCARYCSV
jgi:hypothetical protein